MSCPDLKLACDSPAQGVPVTRLSDLFQDKWKGMVNRFGDAADVDFALTAPFQLFTPESANTFRACCETYYRTEHEYSTARTSSCLRGAPKLVSAITAITPALESVVSSLAGVPLKLLDFAWEIAHVNVQREVFTYYCMHA